MALQSNENNIAEQVVQPAAQVQFQQPQQPNYQNNSATFALNGGSLFAAPIPRGVGSEYYTKLKKALLEIYTMASPEVEISLLDLDNGTETALAYSSILVAIRMKKNPTLGVAYHVILIEASGEKLQPVIVNNNSQQIEILRVASDALDNILLERAQRKIKAAFPNVDIFYTEGTVVPSTFNPDDKAAVHNLALMVGLACNTELAIRTPGFRDFNIAEVTRDSTLVVDQFYGSKPMMNAVQQPIRSDLSLVFSSRKNNNAQRGMQSVNAGDKDFTISTLSGFIDLIYSPVANAMFNPYMQQQAAATQKYVPRVVVTDISSNFSYTPGSILLALATSLSLKQDNNWIQYFRPTMVASNEINLRDVGALNIECNLNNDPSGVGTRIDTSADSFSIIELGQYLSAIIQPGLAISLDCPENGPQSWYMSVFAAAAEGQQPAYNVIYDSANRLTNGFLEKYFPKGAKMFADEQSRVHLGTWVDRNGKVCDLRDIDYLAICNLVGDRNPSIIRDFSDTFYRTQFPMDMRLHTRRKILQNVTGETANFTGFAKRVTFNSAFMDAINKAILDTGLPVRVTSPMSGSDFSAQRGIATFAQDAMLNNTNSFFNVGGFGMNNVNSNFVNGQTNPRWM